MNKKDTLKIPFYLKLFKDYRAHIFKKSFHLWCRKWGLQQFSQVHAIVINTIFNGSIGIWAVHVHTYKHFVDATPSWTGRFLVLETPALKHSCPPENMEQIESPTNHPLVPLCGFTLWTFSSVGCQLSLKRGSGKECLSSGGAIVCFAHSPSSPFPVHPRMLTCPQSLAFGVARNSPPRLLCC